MGFKSSPDMESVHEREVFNTRTIRSWSWSTVPWVVVALVSVMFNVYQYNSSQHTAPSKSLLDVLEAPHVDSQVVKETPGDSTFSFSSERDSSVRQSSLSAPWAPLRSMKAASANSTNGTAAAHASGHAGGHSGPHQHDALLFLFNAVVIGILISHLKYIQLFHSMQETVALFVIGMVYSLIQHGLKVEEEIGVWGQSYGMWMNIDPHLLLFTLLPALLTGDAMTIDTSVAKRVALQCLYLAGPGVLINAMLVAVFLQYYFDWEFLLSLVTGSILCATDPVAVVALLKELGASPVLTIQIQGESLLNDGTAIVLFSIAYRMLQGEVFDVSDCIMFLITVALMAWALGMVIGFVFFCWIRAADNKLQHSAEIIQITLTLAAGYWSFIIAEGVFHISGVLACVASALTLAHFMWPHVVDPTSMHHVWHMLETLGNTIIFFLAGALTGKVMVEIDAIDYLHLIVIYIVLLICRGGLIFLSRPLLKLLNKDRAAVSMKDAAVMTWGGLRGAVGLALAIQVHNDRAPDENGVPQISAENGRRVLFFVGGIAFLTTIVNATTCPALVNWLGITAQSDAKVQLVKILHGSLAAHCKAEERPTGVTHSLDKVLHHIEHHISIAKTQKGGGRPGEQEGVLSEDSVKDLVQARTIFKGLPQEDLNLCGYDDETNKNIIEMITESTEREETFINVLSNADGKINGDMSRVFNEAFLSLVRASYWRQISKRVLPPGGDEAFLLLHSVQMGLSYPQPNLNDFTYVFGNMFESKLGNPTIARNDDVIQNLRMVTKVLEKQTEPKVRARGPVGVVRFVESTTFNLVMASFIAGNGIYIALEETRRAADDHSHAWLIIESIFTFVFVFEAITKMIAFKCGYFTVAWNVFDFILAIFGVGGCAVDLVSLDYDKNTATGNQSRLLRMTRVLKVARLLRLFRLFKMMHILIAKFDPHEFSLVNGEHFKKFTAITAFIKAHLHAQRDVLQLLCPGWASAAKKSKRTGRSSASTKDVASSSDEEGGGVPSKNFVSEDGPVMPIEMANCLVESQGAVYTATILAVRAIHAMSHKDTLDHISQVRESQDLVEEMEELVLDAQSKGVISGRDAEALTHPLHDHIKNCQHLLSKVLSGFEMGEELKEELCDHGHHEAGILGDHTPAKNGSSEAGPPPIATSAKEDEAEFKDSIVPAPSSLPPPIATSAKEDEPEFKDTIVPAS